MRDINGSKPTSFPLDEEKLSFKIPCPDRPPREKILKLGSMITNRIGLKATADDPEYWGLDALVTDEMADVALKMGVRKPKTLEQLMKLTKMEREPLQKLLDEMAWLGQLGEPGRQKPEPREAVHPAPVRARQRRVFEYAAEPDRRAPGGGGVL